MLITERGVPLATLGLRLQAFERRQIAALDAVLASEALPVEGRSRIRFPAGGDMLMPTDCFQGVAGSEGGKQALQCGVLRIRVGQPVGAFQFNSDGEIVAAFPALETGNARVPSPIVS